VKKVKISKSFIQDIYSNNGTFVVNFLTTTIWKFKI